MTKPDDNALPRLPWWRQKRPWLGAGYVLSAGWMLFVLYRTGGHRAHPLFDYIFIVPLAMWVAGLAGAAILNRTIWRDNPAPPGRPE